ncbi:MAG TPA: heme peroxidase family protein [Anaerolineales bacterium]|nr:heme peroxidase family protein [Anaerolineales bacterium]
MNTKVKDRPQEAVRESAPQVAEPQESTSRTPAPLQQYFNQTSIPKDFINPNPKSVPDVQARVNNLKLRPTVPYAKLVASVNRIKPSLEPVEEMPEEIKSSVRALRPGLRRFHGTKLELSWFRIPGVVSPAADRFGYMSSPDVRRATKLPFNATTQALLGQLGELMGNVGREKNLESHNSSDEGVSTLPAGFTYFGQFVDHDITFDVSSSLDAETDAETINNMRTPALDLDALYGRGPGLDPFLYVFPSSPLPSTAIKFAVGTNRNIGPGGPSDNGNRDGMGVQTAFDVPRMPGTNTAVIGDPRNDENLIVVQFHHAMLRFHNAVVDLLLAAAFTGDIFAEAKRIVTHHYQWAVVHDFLERICGTNAMSEAMRNVSPHRGQFRMPVEFAAAAYRFGHSLIRDRYFVNFNFPQATLGQVFQFNRNPLLPVFSNWVVDFNAFFETNRATGTNNLARKIDSFMANGLESLPGLQGMMAVLATRNLRRGLAFGLPSGQGMAEAFGIRPLSASELTLRLPKDEVALLKSNGGLLLSRTPLWYYILREAAVLNGGDRLGPVGARIVAETFVTMLKRDTSSYLNVPGGFRPILPAVSRGDFTVADMLEFSGVTVP